MIESEFGYNGQAPLYSMSENGSHDLSPQQASQSELPLGPLHNPQVPDILREHGAPDEAIARVFNHKGEVIYTTEDNIDFRDPNLQLFTAQSELYLRLKPVYDLVDYRLRADKPPHGYSHHNLENHVVPMVAQAMELTELGNYSKEAKMLTLISGYGHDLGNVNRRSGHSFDSPALLAHVVPSVTRSEQDWQTVREVMRLHDEKAIVPEIQSWGPLNTRERIAKFREMGEASGQPDLPKVLAAIVIADKADIDRGRINPWAINHEAVANDEHVWVNLCAQNRGFQLSADGKELVLQINFNQFVTDKEQETFSPVLRYSKRYDRQRIHVPEQVHRAFRGAGDMYFDKWVESLNAIYQDRIKIMALMSFVAIPGLESFRIELDDPHGDGNRSQGYTPETLDRMETWNKPEESEENKREFASVYERQPGQKVS